MRCLALLIAALVVAGCGGGEGASSKDDVAGGNTSEHFASPSFETSATAIARQISAQATAITKNVEANAEIGSGLQKSNCTGTVNTQLTQRAHGEDEQRVAKLLAGACGDITRALRAAKAGDRPKAKQLAGHALDQAKQASS